MSVDEITRIKEFRQMRREARGSEKYLLVGIDIAKENHHAFYGTATGKTLLRRLVFKNSNEGFNKLMDMTYVLKTQHSLEKVVYGLEPTASYHKPLAETLIKCGCNVVQVSGVAVTKNRELLDGRWDKNDDKDAANVADLISQGKCQYYDYPSVEMRDLRNLLSLKRMLKKQEHRMKTRIRNNLIAQYFPEFDRHFAKGCSESLAIVKWRLKPREIAFMEYEEFEQLVAPRVRTMSQAKRLRDIWDDALLSIGCEAGEAMQFEGKLMVEYLENIKASMKEVDAQIKEICLCYPEYKYLMSIPGFGPDISSKVIGAIGNPFRFDNGKQVLKLAGLDLNARRSGKASDIAVPKISKRGKAHLRYALYQAALVASTRNKYFMLYYTNQLRGREREKGIKTKMKVKLAAKMLIIAWTLMKKKELFDPAYLDIG
ncbi:IS110 family transposase [Thermodesulfobacteriota bacterium]